MRPEVGLTEKAWCESAVKPAAKSSYDMATCAAEKSNPLAKIQSTNRRSQNIIEHKSEKKSEKKLFPQPKKENHNSLFCRAGRSPPGRTRRGSRLRLTLMATHRFDEDGLELCGGGAGGHFQVNLLREHAHLRGGVEFEGDVSLGRLIAFDGRRIDFQRSRHPGIVGLLVTQLVEARGPHDAVGVLDARIPRVAVLVEVVARIRRTHAPLIRLPPRPGIILHASTLVRLQRRETPRLGLRPHQRHRRRQRKKE
mmetsp:Transcript_6122/g.19980  ORF Transcript_6122/g.19980 Transcript_6122/m.19980 type:complete len:253 (+) Transcript_6122:1175-1933(+)